MAKQTVRERRDIGVNTWVWCSPPTDDRLTDLIDKIARFGFDVVEIPVENVGDWTPSLVHGLLAEHSLGVSLCAVMPEGRELVAADAASVRSTQAYLRSLVDIAVEVGSSTVMGPIYSSVGRTWRVSASERQALYDELATNLADPVAYAADAGVRLGIEPLNRFETSVINTVDQALQIVDRVGSPALGVAPDTFHMAIEERGIPAAIESIGEHLVHIQVCGSDRGAPGGDNIDWPAVQIALDTVGYTGSLCIESFTAENETIAVAASIWRPLAPSQDQLATDGLAFLNDLQSNLYHPST
jgi:D-psicose/D-tagatose/L-ribulose 3-epimerase